MEWKWVWLVLLLLVIAAAVWLLLRRPGGTEVSGSDDPALGRDTDADAVPPSQAGHQGYDAGDTGGAYDAGAGNQPYAAGGQAPADAPFDQSATDSAGFAQPTGYEQDPAHTGQDSSYPGQDPAYTEQDPTYTEPEVTYRDTATGDEAAADTSYDAAPDEGGYPQDTTFTEPEVTYEDTPSGGTGAVDSGYAEGTATEAGYQEGASDGEPEVTYEDTTYEDTTYDDAGVADTTAADSSDWTAGPAAEAPDVERGSDQWTEPAPAADDSARQDSTDDSGVSGSTAATIGAGAAAAGAAGVTARDTGDSRSEDAWDSRSEGAAASDWPEGEPVQTAAEFDTDEPVQTTTYEREETTTYAPAPDASTGGGDAGDYGYDEARAGAAAAGSAAEAPFGAGSAAPAEDGSGPAGWEIKGNAGSMLFHTTESPSYEGTRAEVWFESEEAARAAGFAHWDRKRR